MHQRNGEIKIYFMRDTPAKVSSCPLLFPYEHQQKKTAKYLISLHFVMFLSVLNIRGMLLCGQIGST